MRSFLGFPCSAIGTFSNKLKGKRSHFAIHFKQKGFLGDNSTYLPSILISSYLLQGPLGDKGLKGRPVSCMKKKFALFETSLLLFHLVQFIKWKRIFLELNLWIILAAHFSLHRRRPQPEQARALSLFRNCLAVKFEVGHVDCTRSNTSELFS